MEDESLDEILPGLFLCGYRKSENEGILQKYRITHILTVTEYVPPKFPEKYTYKVCEIDDSPEVRIRDLFDENNACVFLSFIDQALSTGGRVIVHCLLGISRSATSVIAYVMWKRRMRVAEALEFVHSRHTEACPNPGFVLQLQDYQCSLVTCTQFPEDEAQVFRCTCGMVLFSSENVAHGGPNCSKFFVTVAEWMKAWGDEGNLLCFSCSKQIGKFANIGSMDCACGATVSPFYWIDRTLCATSSLQPKREPPVSAAKATMSRAAHQEVRSHREERKQEVRQQEQREVRKHEGQKSARQVPAKRHATKK